MNTIQNNEWEKEFEKLKNRARTARDSGFCGGCEEYKKGVDILLSDFRSLLSSERQDIIKRIEEEVEEIDLLPCLCNKNPFDKLCEYNKGFQKALSAVKEALTNLKEK